MLMQREHWLTKIYQSGRVLPLATDALAWIASGLVVVLMRNTLSTGDRLGHVMIALLIAIAIQTYVGWASGAYRRRWRIASFDEATASGTAWATATAAVLGLSLLGRVFDLSHPRIGTLITAALLSGGIMAATRIGWRRAWETHQRKTRECRTRVLVAGATESAYTLIRSMHRDPNSELSPVALLDDADQLQAREIEGVGVRGKLSDLSFVADAVAADALMITPEIDDASRVMLLEAAASAGLQAIELNNVTDLQLSPTPTLTIVPDTRVTAVAPRRAAVPTDRRRPERFRIPPAVVALGDVIAFNGGILAAYLIRFGADVPEFNLEPFATVAPLLTIVFLGLLHGFDLYGNRWMPTKAALQTLIRPIFLTALFGVSLAFFARAFAFPRAVILVGFPLAGLLVLTWRALAYNVENRIRGRERVLVVVDRSRADDADQRQSLRRLAETSERHVMIESVLDYNEYEQIIERSFDVDLVMLTAAVPSSARSVLTTDLMATGASVFLIPSVLDVTLATAGQSYFHTVEGILLSDAEIPRITAFWKRLGDILISAVALLVLAPICALITLAIRLDSPGRALYSQVRVGRHQKLFTVYKFRSMRNDAEDETGAVLATADDDRITRIGSIIRKTRLDEIPQLWNVLRGDMSLVGPRPERPEFVEGFNKSVDAYSRRFRVRPGVTGLAQVKAGYSATVEEKLRFDLLYVNNASLLLDLRIAIQTLATMLDFSAAEGTEDAFVHSERFVELFGELVTVPTEVEQRISS